MKPVVMEFWVWASLMALLAVQIVLAIVRLIWDAEDRRQR